MDINGEHLQTMVLCTFRYALGRMTYVVGDAVEIITEYWDVLNTHHKILIQREIREAIEQKRAGMDMDIVEWEKILTLEV